VLERHGEKSLQLATAGTAQANQFSFSVLLFSIY